MTSKARKAGQAQSALRNVTPRQVDALTAWEESDPRGLAEVVALIGETCDRNGYDSEVAGYAALIVGGYREGARSDAHAAMAAVARARKTVAAAHALDTWASEETPDMLADVAADPDARGALARYAPAPDAMATWHAGDVVESLTSRDARLALAVDALRTHERSVVLARESGEVAPCGCGDHLARRVALPGILAHLAGAGKDDASYWTTYRATRAAMATTRATFARDGLAGDPAPMAPAHPSTGRTTGGDRTPVTRNLALTVRDANGVERPLTAREVAQVTGRHLAHHGPVCAGDTCGHASCSGIRSDALVRASRRPDHGGEWGKVTTAPASSRDRDDRTGMVRTFAVAPSPRKRPRTGSTGPTTRSW